MRLGWFCIASHSLLIALLIPPRIPLHGPTARDRAEKDGSGLMPRLGIARWRRLGDSAAEALVEPVIGNRTGAPTNQSRCDLVPPRAPSLSLALNSDFALPPFWTPYFRSVSMPAAVQPLPWTVEQRARDAAVEVGASVTQRWTLDKACRAQI